MPVFPQLTPILLSTHSDSKRSAVPAATITFDFRDELLTFCERHDDILREASIGYKETGCRFTLLGFSIGWNQKIVLYPDTVTGWAWPNEKLKFAQEDRDHVLKATSAILSNLGYRVQIKSAV
jgi:hypothetical protein